MSSRVDGKSSPQPPLLPPYSDAQIKRLAREQYLYELSHAAGWTILIIICLIAAVTLFTC